LSEELSPSSPRPAAAARSTSQALDPTSCLSTTDKARAFCSSEEASSSSGTSAWDWGEPRGGSSSVPSMASSRSTYLTPLSRRCTSTEVPACSGITYRTIVRYRLAQADR